MKRKALISICAAAAACCAISAWAQSPPDDQDNQTPHADRRGSVFDRLDKDGDGQISKDEFMSHQPRRGRSYTDSRDASDENRPRFGRRGGDRMGSRGRMDGRRGGDRMGPGGQRDFDARGQGRPGPGMERMRDRLEEMVRDIVREELDKRLGRPGNEGDGASFRRGRFDGRPRGPRGPQEGCAMRGEGFGMGQGPRMDGQGPHGDGMGRPGADKGRRGPGRGSRGMSDRPRNPGMSLFRTADTNGDRALDTQELEKLAGLVDKALEAGKEDALTPQEWNEITGDDFDRPAPRQGQRGRGVGRQR